MSQIIDKLYAPFKSVLTKVNDFLKDRLNINIAKYTLLSTMIVVWAAVAFFEMTKEYTIETGIGLAIIVGAIVLRDVFLQLKKKVDKEDK